MENNGARDLLRQIGCRIKQIRISKKISRAQLAAICAIQTEKMSKIEAGLINITMRTLACIVNELDMTMPEFLEGLD